MMNILGLLKTIPAVLRCYLLVALLAPLLAGHDPLILYAGGSLQFPAFSASPYVRLDTSGKIVLCSSIDWRFSKVDNCVLSPICYSPSEQDEANTNFASPFGQQYKLDATGRLTELPWRYRHWLGTTRSGQDVAAILLHGCRTSLWIGCCAMLIAAIIGLLLGMIAGYYGDDRWRISRLSLYILLLSVFLSVFYTRQLCSIMSWQGWIQTLLAVVFFGLLLWIVYALVRWMSKPLRKKSFFMQSVFVPADGLLTLLTSTFVSLPRLVVVLVLASLVQPSISSLILIIGFTAWAEPARLIRTGMQQLRTLSYLEQAQVAGTSVRQLFWRHALPNLSGMISMAFFTGVAGAILTEAGLSFLGIGLPYGTPSWGMLIHEAKRNPQAWWLVLAPGLAIGILLRALLNFSTDKNRSTSTEIHN